MKIGQWVTVTSCGKELKFKIIGFTKGKKGDNLAILETEGTNSFIYRFVPIDLLEIVF
jgi:hypothetical protein